MNLSLSFPVQKRLPLRQPDIILVSLVLPLDTYHSIQTWTFIPLGLQSLECRRTETLLDTVHLRTCLPAS
jgi:hypothetical protein